MGFLLAGSSSGLAAKNDPRNKETKTIQSITSNSPKPQFMSTGNGGWVLQNPFPQGNNLRAISCPSISTCFAVGDYGTILATANGGVSWNSQSSGTSNQLYGISCPSISTCYAVGYYGTILATTNGGATWNSQSSGTSTELRGISCPGVSTCFAVGDYGTILATTNGGVSWNSQSSGTSNYLPGISCPSISTCYAVGYYGTILAKTPLTTPPPSAPSAVEMANGGSPSQPNARDTEGCSCDPINNTNGNFWHTYSDFFVPGRGIPLSFSHTYNSQFAGVDGPLGFGWTFNYNLTLAQDGATGNVTIQEEGGSQISFTKAGNLYTPPSRTIASLVQNGDNTFTFTRQAQEIFTFSADGKLLKMQDLNGYATTLSYDGSGHLTLAIDPAGRKLTLTYTGNHLTKVTDPDPSGNRFITFSYDGQGNLASVTNLENFSTTFTYDANHQLLTMTDPGPGAGTVTNHYDAQSRVDWQTDQLGRKTTLTYQADGTLITDPKGNATFEQYINGTRVSSTKGYGTPQAATWLYTYDPATLGITSVTDPNGNTISSTYDASGNLLTVTDPLGHTTTNTYNNLNLLASTTDPKGITTTFAYDGNGNLLSRSRPLNVNQNQLTSWVYGDGTHPGDATAMTDPNAKSWTYSYDSYGNQTSLTDPLGNQATFAYNVLGWKLSQVSPKGNVSGGNPAQYTTTFAHDIFGRVASITNLLGNVTSFTYDPRGNLRQTTDARGKVTQYSYDLANQRTQVTRADQTTLKTIYNLDGTISAEYDGKNNLTNYSYDPLGRLVSMTDPLSRSTSYSYDGAGNRLTTTDSMQPPHTTTYTYDTANQLKAITYSDGLTPNVTNIQYDANGLRTSMTDGTGTSSWTYDQLNRVTSYTNGANAGVSYGYDLKGQLTSISYPGNQAVTRAYDNAGHWTVVSDWLGNTTNFQYDENSNLITQTLPVTTGVADSYQYDKADRLMGINYAKSGTSFGSFNYGRDENNQVTSVTPVGVIEKDKSYTYNSLNQLKSAGGTNFNFDAADNITGISSSSLNYDVANQLTTQVFGGLSLNFSYDANGNRTARKLGAIPLQSYSYDQANRLIGFGANVTYRYNGDGLRMSKTVKGVTQNFVWDVAGGLPLLLKDGSTSYVYGPGGLPLEQITNAGQVYYYHHDQLGSTRLLTDSTGKVVASYTFDEWGNQRVKTGAITFDVNGRMKVTASGINNPFGYSGQYTDPESGLIYLRARYYDPATAQFLIKDPIEGISKQRYSYANSDPVNEADPAGLWAIAFCDNTSVGAIVGASESECAVFTSSGDFGLQKSKSHIITNDISVNAGKSIQWSPEATQLSDLEAKEEDMSPTAGLSVGTPLKVLSIGGDFSPGKNAQGKRIDTWALGAALGLSARNPPLEGHIGFSSTETLAHANFFDWVRNIFGSNFTSGGGGGCGGAN